jgi:hypothetical protein
MFQAHGTRDARVVLYHSNECYQIYNGQAEGIDHEGIASRVEQYVM